MWISMINHVMVTLWKSWEYLDYENCKCGKRLINKLVVQREDEILNTTDIISIIDKKET